MPVLRDHYYRLGSELPQERIEAAKELLSELIEVNDKEEWDYALNRLVKGLITTRQSARFGFSMALAEVTRELLFKKDFEFTLDSYLDLVLSTTEVKSSMKGKEERGVLFGRLFGLQILLNSNLLNEEKLVSQEIYTKFISSLIDIANAKSWLRETAIFTLCQYMNQVRDSGISLKDEIFSQVLQSINDCGLNLSPEGLAIYLTIPKQERLKYSEMIVNQKPTWKNGDPFSKGNLPVLSKTLKDVEVVDMEQEQEQDKKQKNSKQKGSWSPRIHFVWDLVILNFKDDNEASEVEESVSQRKRNLQSSKSSKKHKKQEDSTVSFKEFWKIVVDESLFSEKSSHERKYWGFEIFVKFLKALNAKLVADLFTHNFMRCLINQSSQNTRMLNKISVKVLKDINEVCSSEITKTAAVFSSLIDENKGGCWNFDLIVKNKVLDGLITNISVKDLEKTNVKEVETVIAELKDILVDEFNGTLIIHDKKQEEENTKTNDNIQRWALDKLLLLIRSNKILLQVKDSSFHRIIEDVLKLLIKQSFFKKESAKPVSPKMVEICQDRLNSILSDIINTKRKGLSWSSYCCKYIQKLEASEEYALISEFDEELTSVKEEMSTLLQSILDLTKKGKSKTRSELFCFELLFSMVLIQFYMGDEETTLVLEELKVCYDQILSKVDDEEVNSSFILTEVILGFVSRKSSLMKKLSLLVWESFLCGKDEKTNKIRASDECLRLLYDVLETKENKEGQQKLFEGEGEFGESEDEEGEHSHSHSHSESNSDSSSEDEDEDEDEDDEDNESNENGEDPTSQVDKDTNMKLAQALGIPTGESGEVKFDELDSMGEDDDDYESDSMDDEQMMAMDEQLSKIFKERHEVIASAPTGNKRKAEVLEAKEHMIFFKNRILDLLESFNKVNQDSYMNLSMIKPLVILINLTLDKNLGMKAHKLLKTRLSKVKVADFEVYFPDELSQKEAKESLTETIQCLQDQAASPKSSNQSHSLACNQACILISKNLVNLDSSYLPKIIDIYTNSLKNWAANSKNKIQVSLFFDFLNWLNSKRS